MLNESDDRDLQNLIEAFFAALEIRDLDQCEAVLAQLRALSCAQPAYAPWCAYCEGVMANESDHDWAEAERIFSRLLLTDLNPPLHSRVLLALGVTYEYQGRWAEAIGAYERTLRIFAQLRQFVDQVKVWKNMAIAYRRGFTRGDFGPEALERAIACCQSALDVLDSITDLPDDLAWLRGSVWNTRGLTHRSLGQWDQAMTCYQQDLDICRSLNDRHGIGVSYLNLGEVYQKRGRDNWPAALEVYQKALSLIREFKDCYLEVDVLTNLGLLYQEMGKYELALDYYSQAIDLIEDLRAGISSEEARAGFFATIVDAYANTVLLCLEAGLEEQAFNYVERARSRAFLDVLAAGSPDLAREMAAETMALVEVQAALPADALLIEYFTTGLIEARSGRLAPGQDPQRHRFPPARTLIFAVTRDGIQVHDAGISPNDLVPRRLDNVVERRFLKPEARRTLYDRLIAPVEELLQGKHRLYLVPHGPLHYIPFQTLTAPDGDILPREAGPQLVYAPSATLLFRYRRAEPSRAPASCLALGYNGQGATRLRFAEEEARGVARLTGGQFLVGSSLKKMALYSQAANYRLLHLSCHGDFDLESPLASALHLAPNESLTALDILDHLRLHCDLVTLSACESGLSRVRRGDELVGLIRAFMYAGAPALVTTLWRVDERSTRILMEKFYQEVQNGIGFAEALKRAQLYLRNLTRKEALEILERYTTDDTGDASPPLSGGRSDSPATTVASQQANAYLKGLATGGGEDSAGPLPGKGNQDKVFADPYYWAPFILVGDHGSA
ncbi:MAG: CHAT domain-containing protein [Dehalococcoidia bacterium]